MIDALPIDVRDRVLERAAILWESGVSDEESTRLAYEMETGGASASSRPGVAQLRARDADEKTGSG